MAAIRKELDDEYETQVGTRMMSSKDGTVAKNPAKFGLDRRARRRRRQEAASMLNIASIKDRFNRLAQGLIRNFQELYGRVPAPNQMVSSESYLKCCGEPSVP